MHVMTVARGLRMATALALVVCGVGLAPVSAGAKAPPRSLFEHGSAPDFGANVIVLNPTMPQSTIQAAVNSIATQQVANQFGPQR